MANKFINKIIREYRGDEIEAYFAKYHYSLPNNDISMFKGLETEFLEDVYFSILIDTTYGKLFFKSYFFFTFRNNEDVYEINQLIQEDLGMKFKMPYVGMIEFGNFYGLEHDHEPRYDKHTNYLMITDNTDYNEVVSWIKAAVDMLLYYLPHISTKEDFIRLMKAHYAGETNFSELTLPNTDPSKRQFEDSDKYYYPDNKF